MVVGSQDLGRWAAAIGGARRRCAEVECRWNPCASSTTTARQRTQQAEETSLDFAGKPIDQTRRFQRLGTEFLSSTQQIPNGDAQRFGDGHHGRQAWVSPVVLDGAHVVRGQARTLSHLFEREPERSPSAFHLAAEGHPRQRLGTTRGEPRRLVLYKQPDRVDMSCSTPRGGNMFRELRIAMLVSLATAASACFPPSPWETPSPSRVPTGHTQVDPSALSCDALADRPGGCGIERDCEKQCDSGEGRACEQMGRKLLTDHRAALLWPAVCGGQRLTGPWCSAGGDALDAAASLLTRACDLGSGTGCFGLAVLYTTHPEKAPSPNATTAATNRARALLEKTCSCGNKPGCEALAKLELVEAMQRLKADPPDEKGAIDLLTDACERGSIEACQRGVDLATHPRSGPPDTAKADELVAKACKNGSENACRVQERLATTSAQPDAPSRSEDADSELRAAEGQCPDPQACETACAGASTWPCVVLAKRYWDGATPGFPKDMSRSVALYRGACTRGNRFACGMVDGLSRAASSCDVGGSCASACDVGLWPACMRLGDAYLQGDGVPKDPGKTLQIFKKACDAGEGDGCNALGSLYMRGLGAARDFARARAAFSKGCDAGKQEACENVKGAQCIADAVAPSKRSPALDPYCNPHGNRAAKPGEPMPRKAYAAGDASTDLESDGCYMPLRNIGCTGIRAHRIDKAAWCCD